MAHPSQSSSVGCTGSKSKAYSVDDIAKIKSTSRNPDIWAYFDLCEMKDGAERAHCKRCKRFYSPTANTSLRIHISKCKGVVAQDSSQCTLGADGGLFFYDGDALRQAFTKFVIQQTLPFNHFDNQQLTEIIKTRLQPRYQQVSRTTLRNDAFELWENARQDIINGFANYQHKVSITCDVWTAPHGTSNGYLAVTAHWFIPESWLLMKRTIAFRIFGYPHTGCNLRKILQETFRKYNLTDKILTISVDNASNNTAAMDRLKLAIKPPFEGAFFHSRCVAHVINLAVQAALTVCDELRTKFRKVLITIYSSSNERQAKYRKFRKECNETPLGPSYDNNTRWNSTCIMFENILRQRDTLNAFNELLVNKHLSISISNQEWDDLAKLTSFLQVFKDATTQLSGVYYPTSPLVLNQLYLMTEKLDEFARDPSSRMFRNMVHVMKKKFKRYFKSIPLIFTCAAALNPTLNVSGVKLLIQVILKNLDCTHGEYGDDADYLENELQKFQRTFDNLFAHYADKYGRHNPYVDSNQAGPSSSRMASNLNFNLYNDLLQDAAKRQRSSAPSSELGLYQCDNFITSVSPEDFISFDVVGFWKEREVQYPILASMARDLFTAQASTVASESAFSVSGRIISERRSRLTPEAVEVCVCLKDYLDGVDRIQDKTTLEGPIIGGDVEDTIINEEIESGISPTSTDLDEGEYEELERNEEDVEGIQDIYGALI